MIVQETTSTRNGLVSQRIIFPQLSFIYHTCVFCVFGSVGSRSPAIFGFTPGLIWFQYCDTFLFMWYLIINTLFQLKHSQYFLSCFVSEMEVLKWMIYLDYHYQSVHLFLYQYRVGFLRRHELQTLTNPFLNLCVIFVYHKQSRS